MEAAWVLESDETDFDRIGDWAANWAQSVSGTFRSGVETIRGYQRRRQTLYGVLFISVIVGILGNALVQVIFAPLSVYNVTMAYEMAARPTVVVIVILMLLFVAAYWWNERRYGPTLPAIIFLILDYPTLIKSYTGDQKNDIRYLMNGTGVQDFDEAAKRVLKLMIEHFEAGPLRSIGFMISDLKYDVLFERTFTTEEKAPISVSVSGDLKEAQSNKWESVNARLTLRLDASRFKADLKRANGIRLAITISITNPTTPLADDFLTQVIEPTLPELAWYYSISVGTQLLPRLITTLRRYIKGVSKFNLSKGVTDGCYLMNYYPFNGRSSKYMIIIDKSLVENRFSIREDFLAEILENTELFGCYVTDSDDWIADNNSRPMRYKSHHLIEELIYVRPETLITIGLKSKLKASEVLEDSPVKPQVINILEHVCEETNSLKVQLRQELEVNKIISRQKSTAPTI